MDFWHDHTLTHDEFVDLQAADTGIAPVIGCPDMDTPEPAWSVFHSYPDNQLVIQHVQVIPAPGVLERVIAADLNEHLSWRDTFLVLCFIVVVTLVVICYIFWQATP